MEGARAGRHAPLGRLDQRRRLQEHIRGREGPAGRARAVRRLNMFICGPFTRMRQRKLHGGIAGQAEDDKELQAHVLGRIPSMFQARSLLSIFPAWARARRSRLCATVQSAFESLQSKRRVTRCFVGRCVMQIKVGCTELLELRRHLGTVHPCTESCRVHEQP